MLKVIGVSIYIILVVVTSGKDDTCIDEVSETTSLKQLGSLEVSQKATSSSGRSICISKKASNHELATSSNVWAPSGTQPTAVKSSTVNVASPAPATPTAR